LYDKIHKSYSASLGPGRNTSSESIFTTSATHYTPPSENRTVSVIPTELFINATRQLFQEKVIIGEIHQKQTHWIWRGDADLFGWLELNDSTWFNTVTGESNEESPYE
jgi:hypothetical protein